MKVIELLNKIANEEISIGTHIVYRDNELIFTGSCLENIKEKSAIAMFGLENLNNKVEIIKEDKKIEKIDVNYLQTIKKRKRAKVLGKKINEIIDKINGMEEK